jgi:Concanavalin A-like lectin/glucanases superfamily/FecR protein
MRDPADSQRFDLLLGKLSEAALTDAERDELGRAVESSSILRGRYLDYCQMHALLRAEHGLLASWEAAEIQPLASSRSTFWQSRLARRSLAAFSAAVSLACVVALLLWPAANRDDSSALRAQRPYRGPIVGHLTKQVHAKFLYGAHGETIPTAGSAVRQGTYELQSGIIEIKSASGAVLTIEAPATFTLADDQCVRMGNGKLAAHVPKEASGFRVETASATVVDLGTDFAVEAVTGKDSEVHVFNGEVRINLHGSKTSDARPLHLTTGKAARIDFLTGMPSGIDLDEDRFLRQLEVESGAYANRVLAMAPAVYYRMEPAGDGTCLTDSSRNKIDATINWGRATEPVWARGKVGLAFALGGPGQQTFGSAEDYPQAQGNELSVVAWVSARSRPRWASIAKNWAGSEQWGQFHFGLYYDTGELEAHIQDSSGKEITVKDNVPLPLGDWHHVAFVADGAMLRLYRNGQQVSAAPYKRLLGDARIKALAIGTKLDLSGKEPDHSDFNMWDGRLDELAIFNHTLSPEQIRELYEVEKQ